MPFYFRKSISAGPFRFNFSKGGVGASVGIKGLRIGTGPRGHYVHAGRGGIYYRATIGRAGERRNSQPVVSPSLPATPQLEPIADVQMIEFDSGDVLAMRDEAFGDLLDEINQKRRQPRLAGLLAFAFGVLGILAALLVGALWLWGALLALPGWLIGGWADSYRRTTVLYYDLAPEAQAAYEEMVRSFDALMDCAGKWHVAAGGAIQDIATWKRNAGASHLVDKKPTALSYKLPSTINSNITPAAVQVGKQILYFFPDAAFVEDGDRIGAVGYASLTIISQDSNFIEEGSVPSDAQVISHTWKHPNKRGGPDKRFKDNRQLPICRYEVMHFTSGSGLNEIVEFSRTGVGQPFASALEALPKNSALSSISAGK